MSKISKIDAGRLPQYSLLQAGDSTQKIGISDTNQPVDRPEPRKTKNSLADSLDDSRERYKLLYAAIQAIPDSRVTVCKHIAAFNPETQGAQSVRIAANGEGETSFMGAAVCGSVWLCPVCNPRIAKQRQQEILHAMRINRQRGGVTLMLTITFSHSRNDVLAELLKKFTKSLSKMKGCRRYKNIRRGIGYLGSIRALEFTHSDRNGWHPHVHEILFLKQTDKDEWIGNFEGKLQDRWLAALQAVGGSGIKDIALKLSKSDQYIAEYIAKFGRSPKDNGNWDMTKEVAKSVAKKSNDSNHATPTELLIAYGNKSGLAATLWVEYVTAFHGKQQMVWSRGLKAYFAIEELSEDEITRDDKEPYDVLAVITPEIWRFLLKEDHNGMVRAEILTIAKNDGLEALLDYINQITELHQITE